MGIFVGSDHCYIRVEIVEKEHNYGSKSIYRQLQRGVR